MQLQHIDLADLKTAAVNVRKHGGRDVSDLVPSIRSLGVLQPLLVRPNCEGYEIVAGQRRYRALLKLPEEGGVEPVPCIVMQDGDDARAIEASLAENIARLPMDEIDQYKAFAALVKEGADAEEIASRFGVTMRLVRQRLAIANIIPPILTAYRRGDIRSETLRILTMASCSQQKAWLELFRSEDEYAPRGPSPEELAARRRGNPDRQCAVRSGRVSGLHRRRPVRQGQLLRQCGKVLGLAERRHRQGQGARIWRTAGRMSWCSMSGHGLRPTTSPRSPRRRVAGSISRSPAMVR